MTSATRDGPWPIGYRTRRVRVRQVQSRDVAFIADLHADHEVMRHVGSAVPAPEAEAIARRLVRAAHCAPPAMYAWMLQTIDSGVRIGLMTVVPTAEPARGELGLLFVPDLSRHGYATEVVAALLDHVHACGGALDARHRPDNLPVRRLMLRLGFLPGQAGSDYAWWRSARTEPVAALLSSVKG